METKANTIAVVEDNGVARMNLRYHLLEMGFQDIGCYSQGRELKASLKIRKFDILLMDYHLGDNKNGVEVIQDLKNEGLIKETTSIIFITSDHMPMIIGQIVDVHPDALVLKPYSIRKLERTIDKCIAVHKVTLPVLKLMDHENYEAALECLVDIIDSNEDKKIKMDLLKLRARLHIKLEQYDKAIAIYNAIFQLSEKIIWVRWGLIQAYYLKGDVETSEKILNKMIGTNLTNDKACEWMARIFIERDDLEKAEEYVGKIRDGDMSVHAARLKAQVYRAQNKLDEAIELLEKKRESNRNIKERFAELSFDLCRVYLQKAEGLPAKERKQSLQVAKFLVNSAGRRIDDEVLRQKMDYLLSLIAILEGDEEKAMEILNREGMDDFENAEVMTMADAVKAWHEMGYEQKASEILLECEQRLGNVKEPNEKTISNMMVSKGEEQIGDKGSRGVKFNKLGMECYDADEADKALDNFYQAHMLAPDEAAFSLNLLQSLVDMKLSQYKKVSTIEFYNSLGRQNLSQANKQRFMGLKQQIEADKTKFEIVEDSEEVDDSTSDKKKPNRLADG